jgi:hypothetical protein
MSIGFGEMVRASGGFEAVWQELQLPPPRPGNAEAVLAIINHISPVAMAVHGLLKMIFMARLHHPEYESRN